MQFQKLCTFKKNSKLIRLTKFYSELLKTKQILNFFIGGLKRSQFSKLGKVVINQKRFLSFLVKLECRFEFILVKTGFALTGKQAKQLILHGHVLINGASVKIYNYQLKVDDLVSVDRLYILKYKTFLLCSFFKTAYFLSFLKKKRVFKKLTMNQLFMYFKFPFFTEVNYKTFTLCLVKQPDSQELFFPKILSLYDCNQLYFII